MAALSDHDRRDAEDALRVEIGLIFKKYIRRGIDLGKAYIKEELDESARLGRPVDATALGREAAARALENYFGVAAPEPHPAIDAATDTSDLSDGFA